MRSYAQRLAKRSRDLSLFFVLVGGSAGWWLAGRTGASPLFGDTWMESASTTRTGLATLFGLQVALLSVVLSLTILVLQVAANQYSPRLQALYARQLSARGLLWGFSLSSAYLFAATLRLGDRDLAGLRPRPVLAGALLLLATVVVALLHQLIATLGRMRIDVVLQLIANEAMSAHRRLEAALARGRFVHGKTIDLPVDALPLRALGRGYIVAVDLARMTALARALEVRVALSRTIGDFVDRGDIVGWFFVDATSGSQGASAAGLSRYLFVGRARDVEYDVGLGLRILTDVADRALSPAVNDPYTARQALNQSRAVLRPLSVAELGAGSVCDDDGSPRVSMPFPSLSELMDLVADGPIRFGGSDPDVVESLFAIAIDIGRSARSPVDRAAARLLVQRIVQDAIALHRMEGERLDSLRRRAALVEQAITSTRVDVAPRNASLLSERT